MRAGSILGTVVFSAAIGMLSAASPKTAALLRLAAVASAQQVPVEEQVEPDDSPSAEAAGENTGADVPAVEAAPPDTGPPAADQPPAVQPQPVEP